MHRAIDTNLNQFHVIEKWFNTNKQMFDYTIEIFLLFIHLNSYSCKETETKILENIFKTILLTMDCSSSSIRSLLEYYTLL